MTEKTAVVRDLEASLDGPRKKQASLLKSQPPPRGTPHEELAAWLTVVLGLGADPLQSVERYGRHEEARAVLILRSGQRVTFERQVDTFDPRKLVRTVVMATGATMPSYGVPDALKIATAINHLSDLRVDDDQRDEAREWGRTFLAGAGTPTTIDETEAPVGRWAALKTLTTRKPAEPYASPAERAQLVEDSEHGTRLLRVGDFAAHVRSQIGKPLGWAAIHGRMVEVGWEHRGEVQQRQPQGQGKVKAHIYAVPAGWEHE